MKTNGCTYGIFDACGNHGPRQDTLPYQKPGAVTHKTTYNPGVPWMKRGTERRIKPDDATRLRARLDATAHRKISYEGPGVLIRKAADRDAPREGREA